MKLCAEKPCKTCHWRKSSTVGGADIPGFNMDKMRGLSNTAPPAGSEQDGFYKVMACHHSKEGQEFACAGYIARHGWQNINVRLMAATHNIPIQAVIEQCQDIELYDNFHSMLASYEAAQGHKHAPRHTQPHKIQARSQGQWVDVLTAATYDDAIEMLSAIQAARPALEVGAIHYQILPVTEGQ